MITHEVINQAPERVGVNEFESNVALVDGVRTWGSDRFETRTARAPQRSTERQRAARAPQRALVEAGALVGSGDFQRDVDVTVTPDQRWHWRGGASRWTVRIHNAGDVHENVSGSLQVEGLLADGRRQPLRPGILLPGETRTQHVTVDLRDAPALLTGTARVRLDDHPDATESSERVVVLPWWLLVLLGVLIAVGVL